MERKFKIGFAIFWTILIPIVCLMSFSNVKEIQQIKVPNIDKIVHFCMYFILSVVWICSLTNAKKANSFKQNAILIFIAGSLFGIIIEFLQENFTETRSGEVLDVLSNCTGIIAGIIISKLILK